MKVNKEELFGMNVPTSRYPDDELVEYILCNGEKRVEWLTEILVRNGVDIELKPSPLSYLRSRAYAILRQELGFSSDWNPRVVYTQHPQDRVYDE